MSRHTVSSPKVSSLRRARRAHDAMAALLVAALDACLAARPAPAAGLSLAWQDCRTAGSVAANNAAFGCAVDIQEIPLFPSFTLAAAIDSVYSMELVIDVDVDADPLPAWWHMEPGGCRANAWTADAALAGSCTDGWNGRGNAAFQGWIPGTPAGASPGRHARLLVAAGVLAADAVHLDANVPYTACRVLLRTVNTVACNDGCATPACMVFNSLLIRRLHLPSDEEVFLSGPEVGGSDRVVWQGGVGADCQAVPVRRTTWGAVKALYR